MQKWGAHIEEGLGGQALQAQRPSCSRQGFSQPLPCRRPGPSRLLRLLLEGTHRDIICPLLVLRYEHWVGSWRPGCMPVISDLP